MGGIRKIKRIIRSKLQMEGAGVRLQRVFGHSEAPSFDPFLMLDDFRSDTEKDYIKGFPWHPHRGIETVTYVLKGEVEHGDSMGNKGVISEGDIQWMTAGSGIVHQEMPQGDPQGKMYGFQLWVNLPSVSKMMHPRYQEINSSQIPEIEISQGIKVKIIAGSLNGTSGPVKDIVAEPEYLDIMMPANSEFEHPTPKGHTVFAYVYDGEGVFEDNENGTFGNRTLVHFNDGDRIIVHTKENPVRFLLVAGKPIGEKVAWRGPIVMNTEEELQVAFEEYKNGTFIKS